MARPSRRASLFQETTMSSDPQKPNSTVEFQPPDAQPSMSAPASDRFDDYLAQERAHQAQAESLRPANKQALLTALANVGIARLTVTFDGYGDSGQIESIEAVDVQGAAVPLPDVPIVTLSAAVWGADEPERHDLGQREAVEWFVYDMLGSLHGGWEINEGSYGQVVFDVAAGSIALDMNTRFVGSEQHLTTI
jgi:hypothetical protein